MKLFLSYSRSSDASHEVRALAKWLGAALKERDPKTSIFFDVQSISPGERFPKKLEDELKSADVFLALISPAWFDSEWCRKEYDLFTADRSETVRRKRVLPLLWVDTPQLDAHSSSEAVTAIQQLQYSDWRDLRYGSWSSPRNKRAVGKLAEAALKLRSAPELDSDARQNGPVTIERITSSQDPLLLPALEMYERRILADDRDPAKDITRWLDEVASETEEGTARIRDYLLVAHARQKVCAFIYFHYYPRAKYAFVSYLATDDRVSDQIRMHATPGLMREVRRLLRRDADLKDCRGVVVEVDPRAIAPGSRKRSVGDMIERFRTLAAVAGRDLCPLDIPYRQPRLSLSEDGQKECPLLLMYGPLPASRPFSTVNRKEIAAVLRFIHRDVYGDSFENDPREDRAYRRYLDKLLAEQISHIPPEVRGLSLGQVVAGRGRWWTASSSTKGQRSKPRRADRRPVSGGRRRPTTKDVRSSRSPKQAVATDVDAPARRRR